MRKYFFLAKIVFQEFFAYRVSFFLWQLRTLVMFLALVFLWLAIYGGQDQLFGYQKSQMITYVLGVAFLRSVILATQTGEIAHQIRSGSLTCDLLRPWGIFKVWFTRDLVNKLLNLILAVIEIGLIIYFLKLPFYLPTNFSTWLGFITVMLFSLFLYFFISFWLSMISFWADQPWAPRWLFGIIFLEFLSGGLFPLDVLPPIVAKISAWTPFPYLIYFPLKIWLEQIDPIQLIKVVFISLFWLVAFWLILKKTWEKGLKNYSAYGG